MKKILVLFIIIMCFVSFGVVGYAAETHDGLFNYETARDSNNNSYVIITGYNGVSTNEDHKTVAIPATIDVSSSQDGMYLPVKKIQSGAFQWNDFITSVTIPSSIHTIDGIAFNGCSSLTGIIIPESVTTIGSRAFAQCDNLESIIIPEHIVSLASNAFDDCLKLQRIDVDGDNLNYKSVNGVLFNKTGTTLIRYPEGKTDTSYTIPDGVETIGASAFYNCDNLESVSFSDDVNTIDTAAFSSCAKLDNVILPETVSSIGNGAFYYGSRLKKLTIFNRNASIGTYMYAGSEFIVIYCYENSTAHDYIIDNSDGSNRPWHRLPEVVKGIPNQLAVVNTAFNYTIPDDTFNLYSSNGGYDYTYEVSGIPSGITFSYDTDQAVSGNPTFSGTPTAVGSSDITVTITESGNSVSDTFTLNVTATNTQPAVINEIPDQEATVGQEFSYTIPSNTFENVDGFIYSAAGIPQGLTFNATTKTFTGTPTISDLYMVTVTVTDGNNSVSNAFDIAVNSGNEPQGDWLYEKDDSDSYVIITGYTGAETSLVIPSTIDNMPIKEIGMKAFQSSSDLVNITLPNTITKIGESAFEGCGSLESINVPVGVTEIGVRAFRWCGELDNITLPNTMTEIKSGTFANCGKLSEITIADTITKIGSQVFFGCYELTDVSTILTNVTEIGASAFSKSGVQNLIIPSNVNNISSHAFYWCSSLESVEFSGNVETIGPSVFEKCESLESVVLPSGMTEIPTKMFMDSGSLLGITFPTTLIEIGSHAFENCDGLTSVSLPSNVATLNTSAFKGLSNLEKIYIYNDNITFQDNETIKDCFTSLKIYANPNSTSENYANTNNITFVDLTLNNPPTLANEIPDQTATVGDEFAYIIPDNTFADVENDDLALTMSTTSLDIAFDSNSREIRYTPSVEETVSITITATDTEGESVTDTFYIVAGQLPTFTTLSVSNITSSSAQVTFELNEVCEYAIAVMLPRENNNYAGPGWTLSQGKIVGDCDENEEVIILVTQMLSSEVMTLQAGTEYALCVRVKDIDDNYIIEYVLFTTLKNSNVDTPVKPELDSKTYNSVTLENLTNYEYSKDNGQTWQDSNIFDELSASTNYTFIQRIKETEDTYASDNSDRFSVTTDNRPSSGGDSSSRGGDSSSSGSSKSVSGAKTISSFRKGDNVTFTIEQKDVKVEFNGLAFKGLEDKKVQTKIKEIDKKDLDLSNELQEKIGDLPIFDISIYVDGEKEHFESDEPIVIEIPVDTELDNHKVVAVYIDEDGNTQIMEGVLSGGIMKFTTNHLSDYALMYVDKSFDDVAIEFWGAEAIEALAAREVVNGIGSDMFNPNGEITRAEFVTIMVKYFDLTSNSNDNFAVESDTWYAGYIAIAKDNNILPEIYDDVFEPNVAITRQEMMYILYKSLEVEDELDTLEDNSDKLSDFTDSDTVSDYAVEGSEYLISRDIINGSGDGMFNPTGTSTRAEVAQMMWNMINLNK